MCRLLPLTAHLCIPPYSLAFHNHHLKRMTWHMLSAKLSAIMRKLTQREGEKVAEWEASVIYGLDSASGCRSTMLYDHVWQSSTSLHAKQTPDCCTIIENNIFPTPSWFSKVPSPIHKNSDSPSRHHRPVSSAQFHTLIPHSCVYTCTCRHDSLLWIPVDNTSTDGESTAAASPHYVVHTDVPKMSGSVDWV